MIDIDWVWLAAWALAGHHDGKDQHRQNILYDHVFSWDYCCSSVLYRSRSLATKAFCRPGPGFLSFNLTIARRSAGHQRLQQFLRCSSDLFDCSIESKLVGLRRFCEATKLAHELKRRSAYLSFSGRRFEVV